MDAIEDRWSEGCFHSMRSTPYGTYLSPGAVMVKSRIGTCVCCNKKGTIVIADGEMVCGDCMPYQCYRQRDRLTVQTLML